MPEAAGFIFEHVGAGSGRLAPLVLLHGSGLTESFLIDFARAIGPDRDAIALRGRVPWEGGYAFFKRNADRSLDHADLAARCSEVCGFLQHVSSAGSRKPIVVGYSNGAIMAAAAAIQAPGSSAGSVLLRPLSPYPAEDFPPLHGYPVLLLGGAEDARRHPSDTPHLAAQFQRAGALVTARVLPTGHSLDEADLHAAREWLADRG